MATKKKLNRRVNRNQRHTPPPKSSSPSPAKNASTEQGSGHQTLNAWLNHHKVSCTDSLQRLLKNPWQSLMIWLVVAIALVLPSLLYLGLENSQHLGTQWQNSNQLSLYLKPGTQPAAIEAFSQKLLERPDTTSVDLISPEQGMREFIDTFELGSSLASLEDNPLPSVLIITPAQSLTQAQQLVQLQQALATESLVDTVQLDLDWLQRLQQIIHLTQRLVLIIAIFLALGVLLIIGNTIRLTIENRRSEIIVVKMVGGTNGFVRRPFLYTGLWYGAGGGILALILLLVTEWWLSAPIVQLLNLYGSDYSLSIISLNSTASILFLSCLLGWGGAWISVSQHLRHIEPH